MSRYPWRDTSEDISGQTPSQWETPGGAQEKADKALQEANQYTDEKNLQFDEHIHNKTIHVTQADKDNWNSKAPGSTKTEFDAHKADTNIHVTAAKKAEWDSKAPGSVVNDLSNHIADNVKHLTAAEHTKLTRIEDGAQVNQNAFARVNDIVAGAPTDALIIKPGQGIAVSTNPNTKELTITQQGTGIPGPHGPSHTEHGADPIPTATLTEGGILSAAQLAEIVAHGELLDEHSVALTDLEDGLAGLAGSGRTSETVKGNADKITGLTAQMADKATHAEVAAAETNAKNASLPRAGGVLTGPLTVGSRLTVDAPTSAPWMYLTAGGVTKGIIVAVEPYVDIRVPDPDGSGLTNNLRILYGGDVAYHGNVLYSARNSGPFYKSSGSPEGNVAASPGSLCQSSTGAVYVKKTGTGNTGWKEVQTL